MIFNALTLMSLFGMIFSAILFMGGALTLLRIFRATRERRHIALSLFFFIQCALISALIITTLSYSLGVFSGSLKTLSKLDNIIMLLAIPLGFYFTATRLEFSRTFMRWALPLIFLAAMGLSIWTTLTPAILTFPANLLEPNPQYAAAMTTQALWVLFLTGMTVSYILHSIRTGKPAERSLSRYSACGVFLMNMGWITRYVAIQKEAAPFSILAWGFVLVGSAIWFLAEALPEKSIYATRPLQFLQSRILLKLIFLFVLLLVVLPEAAMIGAVHLNQRAITSEVQKNFIGRAERLAEDIENHFVRMRDDIHRTIRLARSSSFSVQEILQHYLKVYPDILAVAEITPEGTSWVLAKNRRRAGAQWPTWTQLQKLPSSEETWIGSVTTQSPTVIIAISGLPGHFWVAQASLEFVEQRILKNLAGGKGLSLIVDSKGKILLHPDPALRKDTHLASIGVIQKGLHEPAVGEYTGAYDTRYAGAAVPIPLLGWAAVVQEPVSSAYADIQQIINGNILLVVLTTLITVLAGILFAQSVERPILEVIRGTDEVRKGNLGYVIPVQTRDEIGELAGAFNQMTRELHESQEHLIASEKLAALGTMAAGMAHEIKNPLVSLRTFTQLLPQKFEDPEFREKFSTIVPHEIEKINKIAENLLKFGRPSKPELKKVNVNEILEDVISLFENECRKHNIRITIKLARLPEITGDPGQLSQAFINIILNGIQAMDNGGELTVKTDIGEVIRLGEAVAISAVRQEPSQREMVWGVVEKGSSHFPPAHHTPVVFVEVTDTGPGIPENTLKNIFDPFYTTKAKGTGMGLPITLRIIEEHQGSVKVKSAEGKGTTFIITLPQDLQKKT